jgi:hypothetical protein
MKTLLLILSITLFSCGEDIKLSTLDGHKKAILIDKYPYGSLKTSVLILKKNNTIYKVRCYNSEIGNLKIKDTIK